MPRRLPQTLADYVVVAICPVLIGLLVGSLMYFLVLVFYSGEQTFRLLWVMTMFVVAIVGIARLSMEQGMAYASLFAAALAGAVALVLPPTAWPLLALVWWATHKLTWDSTLVDDSQDMSGQGLVTQIGKGGEPAPDAASEPLPADWDSLATTDPADSTAAAPAAWWQSLLEPDRRPHAPGLWVIYFSLAALPIFGVGGWFATDTLVRQRIFWLTVLYVASGMSLLAATSFLGLRRYLRQRRVEMPLEITATWLTSGGVVIVAVLLLAILLPRPTREYSLSQAPFAVAWTVKKASDYAFLPGGIKDKSTTNVTESKNPDDEQAAGDQPGEKGGQPSQRDDANGKAPGGKKAAGAQKGGGNQDSSPSGDAGDQADSKTKPDQTNSKSKADQSRRSAEAKQSGDEAKDADKQTENSSAQTENETRPQEPAPPNESAPASSQRHSAAQTLEKLAAGATQAIGWLIRLIFYAVLLLGALYAAIKYRAELLAAWRKLLEELRELWAAWFGVSAAKASEQAPIAPAAPPPRSFASFPDPFSTGAAQQMSWVELVNYTFAAVEAWARERNLPRLPDQTPLEFALSLGAACPDLASPARSLASAYSQLAYAGHAASAGPLEPLRGLWRLLNQPTAAREAAANRRVPRATRS